MRHKKLTRLQKQILAATPAGGVMASDAPHAGNAIAGLVATGLAARGEDGTARLTLAGNMAADALRRQERLRREQEAARARPDAKSA